MKSPEKRCISSSKTKIDDSDEKPLKTLIKSQIPLPVSAKSKRENGNGCKIALTGFEEADIARLSQAINFIK